ncbi:hypothetical protein RclHR1_05610012 [Rhizophagus clarus]|uniref:Uncharacterized protein n=1 Tax=Rhizophagus clarus TaxID=94130 RepID=A0A2Z6S0R4_9GLOM|nr:hypothetical protein RclHR1_05610012 [Rhizophagus clarus]GES87605.1 hypothetical protein RCL_jg26493.t1 [Rhizophagus clarus]
MSSQFDGFSTPLREWSENDEITTGVYYDKSSHYNQGQNEDNIYGNYTDEENCESNNQFDELLNFLKEYAKKYGNDIIANCEIFHGNQRQNSTRKTPGGKYNKYRAFGKYRNYTTPVKHGRYGISRKYRNYATPVKYGRCRISKKYRYYTAPRRYGISRKYRYYTTPAKYERYGISRKYRYHTTPAKYVRYGITTPGYVTPGGSFKEYRKRVTPDNVNGKEHQKREQIEGSSYSHGNSGPEYNSHQSSDFENVLSNREYTPKPFAGQFDFIRIQCEKFAALKQLPLKEYSGNGQQFENKRTSWYIN